MVKITWTLLLLAALSALVGADDALDKSR